MTTLDFPTLAYEGIFETIGRAAQSLQPAPPPAPPPSVQILNNDGPASPERQAAVLQELAPSGGISPALADRANRDYRRPQTAAAMRALLGTPTQQQDGIDIYYVAGSSDGIVAGRRLVVAYRDGMAIDWYQDGGSIK